MASETYEIGIIGGSGLYKFEGFEQTDRKEIQTPFGAPSDPIVLGRVSGTRAAFLPRHGTGHRLLPSEIPHRANIWALKSLGVRWLISVSAVGSLQEEHEHGNVVLVDQFYDRTHGRWEPDTFFGEGIVAHVGFSRPVSRKLQNVLQAACLREGVEVVKGGTYVNIQGPQFSTRAESVWYHKMGFDVIGMTNLAEARLAREAEIAYATMAMVTDYDSWNDQSDPVTVDQVIAWLNQNVASAQRVLARAVPEAAELGEAKAHRALADAILTPEEHWPAATAAKLEPLIGKYRKAAAAY
jgi:5'-methylthioadenosine phosphorylase